MKTKMLVWLAALVSGCGAPFVLVDESDPGPEVIIIETGEFTPPPAHTVEIDPPKPVRYGPDAGGK